MQATNGPVLVIDDDIAVADTVAMVLNMGGFEATVAYSGETGVELARNREFDFLVTGVVMPQMNGIEAAIEIRKILPKCKVLLVSGDNDSCALLQEALSRGYKFEILAKPVHPLVLFQTLRSVGTHLWPVLEPFPSRSLRGDVEMVRPKSDQIEYSIPLLRHFKKPIPVQLTIAANASASMILLSFMLRNNELGKSENISVH